LREIFLVIENMQQPIAVDKITITEMI